MSWTAPPRNFLLGLLLLSGLPSLAAAQNIPGGTCPTGSTTVKGCFTVDGTTITATGGVLTAVGAAASLTVGSSTITGGTTTRVLFDNAGVLGEYTISGTGNVAMTTNPTLVGATLTGTLALGTQTVSGGFTMSGVPLMTGLSSGTQLSCLGLDSGNHIVTASCGGGSSAFSGLTSGTNTTAAMVVGAGASLNFTSSGTINASTLLGNTWAAPGNIGTGTPGTGAFAGLTATSSLTATGLVTYADIVNGSGNALLRSNTGTAPSELSVGTGVLTALGNNTNASGGFVTFGSVVGVGVQAGQSLSNIGDNATALPAGHYVFATNATMTAARSHNLPDSATQGVGDVEIIDAQQTVTSTNTLTLAAAGTDKLNGVTNGSITLYAAGSSIHLHNDAAGNWSTGPSSNLAALTNGQFWLGNASGFPIPTSITSEFASPPALGGTAPAAVTGTTLNASTNGSAGAVVVGIGATNTGFYNSAGAIVASVGGSAVYDLTSSQFVVGNIFPTILNNTVNPRVVVAYNNSPVGSNDIAMLSFRNSAAVSGYLTLGHSMSNTLGTMATLATGNSLGAIDFEGATSSTASTAMQQGAKIEAVADGTVTAASLIPSDLVFSTVNSSNSLTQALKLDAAQTATFGNQIIAANMTSSSSAQTGTVCWAAAGLTQDPTLGCLTSSETLKDITGPITDGLATVMALQPIEYKWKPTAPKFATDAGQHPGLGAYATAYVSDELVARDGKGNPRGWRQDAVIAKLVAAIQEQQAEIADLRNQVHAH